MNKADCDRLEIENQIQKELENWDLQEHDADDIALDCVEEAWDKSNLKDELVEQTIYLIKERLSECTYEEEQIAWE